MVVLLSLYYRLMCHFIRYGRLNFVHCWFLGKKSPSLMAREGAIRVNHPLIIHKYVVCVYENMSNLSISIGFWLILWFFIGFFGDILRANEKGGRFQLSRIVRTFLYNTEDGESRTIVQFC